MKVLSQHSTVGDTRGSSSLLLSSLLMGELGTCFSGGTLVWGGLLGTRINILCKAKDPLLKPLSNANNNLVTVWSTLQPEAVLKLLTKYFCIPPALTYSRNSFQLP